MQWLGTYLKWHLNTVTYLQNDKNKTMTKEELIEKYAPRINTQSSGAGTITSEPDPEFESDLDELLRETAEAQKAAVLNQFLWDFRWSEIHPKAVECVKNTPLVTSPNTGDKK